jgi:hypothetical protein
VTFVHGIANVQVALSVPPSEGGSTYATCPGSAHEPSGKHAFEPGHSACARQARHIRSSPQAGVAPLHALAWSGVHCTQVIVPARSQTPAGSPQSSFDMQRLGASVRLSQSLSGASSQYLGLQRHELIPITAANRRIQE